jgi:hypothetical protein
MSPVHSIELCFKEIDRLRASNAALMAALEGIVADNYVSVEAIRKVARAAIRAAKRDDNA